MIFYFNGDGSAVDYVRSEVYQGSHNVNSVYFVGPFSSDCQVTAKFRLENGDETQPQYFTFKQDFSEALFNQNDEGICVWEGLLTQSVTKLSGTVRVQFTVISLTDELTTETVSFKVKKGVVGTNVQVTDINVFDQILQIVSGIQSQFSDASNKLTKVSVISQKAKAYIKEANGDQNMLNISEDGANELVKRKQDGNITAGTPSLGTDATSKAYVDDNFYTKNEVNTLLNSASSQESQNSAPNYPLIEKIIVGYNITTEEPLDWNLNYASYFVNSGTKKDPVYTNVSGDTTPAWEEGKYYYYDPNGITRIWRSVDTNGNEYAFKSLKFYFQLTKAISGGNMYTYIYYGPGKSLVFTITNLGNIQTKKDKVYQINSLIDFGDFVEISSSNTTERTTDLATITSRLNVKSDFPLSIDKKITQISFVGYNSVYIPGGSILYIYGE